MMTNSQTYLRQAEACQVEIDKIQKQINGLECILRGFCDEEHYAREQYRLAYKEELESRRNYVSSQNTLKTPNPIPMQSARAWNSISTKVVNLWSKYNQASGKDGYCRFHLLFHNLSRFARDMSMLNNIQAWNPRNPNPHLP
jgi:hypothetical protein